MPKSRHRRKPRKRKPTRRHAETSEEIAASAPPLGFNHSEAFCLMKYQSVVFPRDAQVQPARETPDCVEWLWNSRDGVTPFVITSADGRFQMAHTDWHLDRCEPNYMPKAGERIFVDLTREKALEYARETFERMCEDLGREKVVEHFTPDGEEAESITHDQITDEFIISEIADSWFEHGTSPDIVTVTPELEFARRPLVEMERLKQTNEEEKSMALHCQHELEANDCPRCERMDYEAALHGVQAGVAMEISRELPGLSDDIARHLKHLRVGVNSALCAEAALARLLIEKGFIAEAEYVEAQRIEMNRELARYEERIFDSLGGAKVRLR